MTYSVTTRRDVIFLQSLVATRRDVICLQYLVATRGDLICLKYLLATKHDVVCVQSPIATRRPQYDDVNDRENLPTNIEESDAYRHFVPQLQHIDPHQNVSNLY